MIMWVDKCMHIYFYNNSYSCNCKNLFRSPPSFDKLQKAHILRAVSAMRKLSSTGLFPVLALPVGLHTAKSYCWGRNAEVLKLGPTGKWKRVLWESMGKIDSGQCVGNASPSHNYILQREHKKAIIYCPTVVEPLDQKS